MGLKMTWHERMRISSVAIFFCAVAGIYSYFVASTFGNLDFLLLCSQGKEALIPKRACQAYLFRFGGSPSEISDINRGAGVLWALSAESTDDKIKLLRFLLQKGVNIDALDERSGVSALHAMVIENDVEGVDLLLKNGANPVVRDRMSGKTPLEFALARQGKPGEPDQMPIINRLKKSM